jgi:hypothetical protein
MAESVKDSIPVGNGEESFDVSWEKAKVLIEKGKEIFSFFDKCFSEVDEYKFLGDRMNQPWGDDIPLTDRVAIEAVLGQKRLVNFDDLKAGEAAIWDNNVEHGFYAIELSSDGREVEFRLCSKSTGGELINFKVAIKESGFQDVLEVYRAGIQLKKFDPDAIQYPILRLNLAAHKFGEEVFITQEKLKGAGGSPRERVTQTTERIIPVNFTDGN